jgi:hypothetical protein
MKTSFQNIPWNPQGHSGHMPSTPYPPPKPSRHNIFNLIYQPKFFPLPTNPTEHTQWVEQIANIGRKVKIETHKIIIKQITIKCKIAITKYRALLNIKPKTIHKKIFHPTIESSLDCIQNSKGDIPTKPEDIANEIYYTQQTSFQRQTPLCSDSINHPNTCQCEIRKYF